MLIQIGLLHLHVHKLDWFFRQNMLQICLIFYQDAHLRLKARLKHTGWWLEVHRTQYMLRKQFLPSLQEFLTQDGSQHAMQSLDVFRPHSYIGGWEHTCAWSPHDQQDSKYFELKVHTCHTGHKASVHTVQSIKYSQILYMRETEH